MYPYKNIFFAKYLDLTDGAVCLRVIYFVFELFVISASGRPCRKRIKGENTSLSFKTSNQFHMKIFQLNINSVKKTTVCFSTRKTHRIVAPECCGIVGTTKRNKTDGSSAKTNNLINRLELSEMGSLLVSYGNIKFEVRRSSIERGNDIDSNLSNSRCRHVVMARAYFQIT